MHGYVKRLLEENLKKALERSPLVAILGPRQCGKSTLAKEFMKKRGNFIYLDLQDRTDRNKLNEPEVFFERYHSQLICFDEIQRLPDFFSTLRSEIDKNRKPGRFLILGSASRDLIRQSNESLAGRIAYLNLSPFLYSELKHVVDWQTLWLRGGFPESVLSKSDEQSYNWRQDFIQTFLERDIPSLGFSIPSPLIERLWQLLAHYHGQAINFSKLASAADLSIPTLKKYIFILEQSYMIRILQPCYKNIKKRVLKSPKIYIKDSGILHSLLSVEEFDRLLAHPVNGVSWEGFAIENVIAHMPDWKPSYIRTSNGAEIDLVMEKGDKKQVFEFKMSKAPKPSKGFFSLMEDIRPDKTWIVAPVDEGYEYKKGIWVENLGQLTGNG